MKNFIITIFLFQLFNVDVLSQTNGIVIKAEYRSTRVCNSDSTRNKITYHIRQDILRVDIKGIAANTSIIYQPLSDKIWVLYHHEKVYYTMNSSELKFLEEEVAKQSDDFQKSIADRDSVGREQTMMIWPDGNPFAFEDPEYTLIKKKDSLISQLMCDKYEGNRNGRTVQLMFVNNFKTMGIKDDELQILQEFSVFMGKGFKALSGNMDVTNLYKKDVSGYPILIENVNRGVLCNTYKIKNIYRMLLDNKLFEIPLAYGKFENPLGKK